MSNILAWLLLTIALLWSLLVGVLAGVGAVVVARRSTDVLNVTIAVLFMFGGALVLTSRLLPGRFLILGAIGLALGIPLALALHSGAPIPLFKDALESAVEDVLGHDPTGSGDPHR